MPEGSFVIPATELELFRIRTWPTDLTASYQSAIVGKTRALETLDIMAIMVSSSVSAELSWHPRYLPQTAFNTVNATTNRI